MFLYSNWLKLSIVTRHKIAEIFGIKKTKPTHVVNNQLADDGYEIQHIETQLTIEAIQKHLNSSETDLQKLWPLLVKSLETPVVPTPVVEAKTETKTEVKPQVRKPDVEQIKKVFEVAQPTKKRRGRPAKK